MWAHLIALDCACVRAPLLCGPQLVVCVLMRVWCSAVCRSDPSPKPIVSMSSKLVAVLKGQRKLAQRQQQQRAEAAANRPAPQQQKTQRRPAPAAEDDDEDDMDEEGSSSDDEGQSNSLAQVDCVFWSSCSLRSPHLV
jgi:hypothetical protein